jgi:hypothetical protein
MSQKSSQKWGDRWADEDFDYLRSNYDGTTLSLKRVAKQLGRTEHAVNAQIQRLGLQKFRKIRQSKWTKEETEYLWSIAGTRPDREVVRMLNRWRRQHDLRERTEWSVKSYCCLNGIPLAATSSGDLLSKADIESGLRCSNRVIAVWLKDKAYAAILKPQVMGNEKTFKYLIKRRNLRKLFIKYPALIDGMRPDMAWFIDLMTEKGGDRP